MNAGGESAGVLRDSDWKVRDLLGEGDNVLVTPIQLLTAYCALMNGGHVFRPQTSDAEKFVADERASLHVEPTHRAALIEGMRGGSRARNGRESGAQFASGLCLREDRHLDFEQRVSTPGLVRELRGRRKLGRRSDARIARPCGAGVHQTVAWVGRRGRFSARVRGVLEATGRRGDGETGRRGEGETGRRGEGETGRRGEGSTIRVKILSEDRVVTIPIEDYVLGVLSAEAAVEDENRSAQGAGDRQPHIRPEKSRAPRERRL